MCCLTSSPFDPLSNGLIFPNISVIQYSPLYLGSNAFAVWSLTVTKSPGLNAKETKASPSSLFFLAIFTFCAASQKVFCSAVKSNLPPPSLKYLVVLQTVFATLLVDLSQTSGKMAFPCWECVGKNYRLPLPLE